VSRELKTNVVVDGVVYGPGYTTVVPDSVAQRIRNPLAWGEDVDSDEGHGVPGNHEQLAAGLLPHAPLQPNQATPSEPAGPGGLNPFTAPADNTISSAVPAADGVPAGGAMGKNETGNAPGQPLAEPARSGKGSGEAAWRAYAEQQGVNTDGMQRDDIIAALRDDGVIQ
jgi:hypothetical protein